MSSKLDFELHKKAGNLIDNSEYNEAFALLKGHISKQNAPAIYDLILKQEDTYKYLLHYFIEGFSDSSRQDMLAETGSTLHFINDSIFRNSILRDSPDIYSSTLRFENVRKATLQARLDDYRRAQSMAILALEADDNFEILKEADETLVSLFSFVWTMFGASSDDYRKLVDSIKSNDFPFEFKAQMISALLLGNLEYFDRKGFNALLDIYDATTDPRISARALAAIILIISTHHRRIENDPKLRARLQVWSDSIMLYPQVREVIMTIIRAHDTQRISSKMQNEVLPQLMKLRPEILKRLGKMTQASDLESLEANPEWEEIINKDGLGDKLKELTDIQMDGGDVMMLAFSNLKSFPFFNAVANWFLPFSDTHNEVARVKNEVKGAFSQILDSEGIMCDSDKFSFILSLSRMPESQRAMISSQMDAQLGQLKEMMADKKFKSSVPEFDMEVTRFIRDIYRFFKLFRRKDDFKDPFAKTLDLNSLPFLDHIISDPEILSLVGEFYFKRGYYEEALPLLMKLERDTPDAGLLWEKIGYCYNALGNLNEALTWYRKAELLHPDSKWLIKKLAQCNRLLENYLEASEYYSKALSADPDNYHLLLNAGHVLLNLGDTAAAVRNFNHADYVNPGKISVWRALAWGEMLNGNPDKSLSFYSKILSSQEKKPIDLINTGHVYFLKGDYKNASDSYRKVLKEDGYDLNKLEEALKEDSPALSKAGGNLSDLNLILENVRYSK